MIASTPPPRRPLRVLLMVRELGTGGTERQAAATATALDRALFAPHVAAFHDRGYRAAELRAAGIPVTRLPVASFAGLSAVRGALDLARLIRHNNFDIVHSFDVPMNMFGAPLARCLGVPLVLTSQRAYRDLAPASQRRILRFVDRMADAITVNCQAIRRHLEADEGVPSSRIELCYNGIDTAEFFPHPAPRPAPLSATALTVGVVCGLRPEKDLGTLLRAFHLLLRCHPAARLVIVGSGSARDELLNLSRDLGIATACHFEPATASVAPWLRALDIFVLPSRSEALSNSLMEAMACGCCCVASTAGGNPELITDGQTGLLFRPGDVPGLAAHLETLAASPDLRRTLAAQAAVRIASGYSLQAAGRRMGEIYRTRLALHQGR